MRYHSWNCQLAFAIGEGRVTGGSVKYDLFTAVLPVLFQLISHQWHGQSAAQLEAAAWHGSQGILLHLDITVHQWYFTFLCMSFCYKTHILHVSSLLEVCMQQSAKMKPRARSPQGNCSTTAWLHPENDISLGMKKQSTWHLLVTTWGLEKENKPSTSTSSPLMCCSPEARGPKNQCACCVALHRATCCVQGKQWPSPSGLPAVVSLTKQTKQELRNRIKIK